MTNFVKRILRPEQPDYPVRSLLDVDFYKFTMLQAIWLHWRDVPVTFELINRTTNIPIAKVVAEEELRAALDHARELRFTRTDIAYLRGQDVYGTNMFSEKFLEFLRLYQLPAYELKRGGDQYRLRFSGLWSEVSLWETIALAIISELYFRCLMRKMKRPELEALYSKAKAQLWENLNKLRAYPGVKFADFGQRRRHSFLWQQFVLGMCQEVLGEGQFTGISNTWMAFHHNAVPIGTNAHELPMVLTATVKDAEAMRQAQFEVLKRWQELYGEGLRVCLPDTYGTAQFLKNAPDWLTADWRGFRQDSGDPFEIGQLFVEWYRKQGIDPKREGKLIIFSDGLTVEKMIELERRFGEQINVAFGWGTHLTNGFGGLHPTPQQLVSGLNLPWGEAFRPFSLVCKVTEAGGRPAVKLSDNPAKATGPKEEVERYLEIFGSEYRSRIAVEV